MVVKAYVTCLTTWTMEMLLSHFMPCPIIIDRDIHLGLYCVCVQYLLFFLYLSLIDRDIHLGLYCVCVRYLLFFLYYRPRYPSRSILCLCPIFISHYLPPFELPTLSQKLAITSLSNFLGILRIRVRSSDRNFSGI